MGTYSYSRLGCFEQCPGKYKYQYIERVKTDIETSVEAFLGSMCHETLEKIYVQKRFMITMELKDVLEYYNSQWKKNWNDAIVIVRDEYNQENYRKLGEKYIEDFYKRYHPFDDARTIGLETQKFVEIGDHKMHVRIDRLALSKDGTYEVHDYKTSNSLPTQQDVDNDKQLALYGYGVKVMYPDAKQIKLIWHYLAFDKDMESQRTDEQLEDLKKDVIEQIKTVESATEFPFKKTALCSWCQFQPICPEFAHEFKTKKLDANEYLKEDGVTLVNKYAELTEKKKQAGNELDKIKEALFAYAEKNNYNSVVGSDVIAAIRSYPRLSFPKKGDPRQVEFFGVLKETGLWNDLVIADVYELAKRINSGKVDDAIFKKLEKYIEKGTTDKVYLRNK